MESFDDLVNRERSSRQSAEDAQREDQARTRAAAAKGAVAISEILRELAGFLIARVEPRPVLIRKEPWHTRDKKSPSGWILTESQHNGSRRFQLLLPNGGLWIYGKQSMGIRDGTMNIEEELRPRGMVQVGDYYLAWGQQAFMPAYQTASVQEGVWAVHYSYFALDTPPPASDAREVLAKLAAEIIGS